MLCERRDHAGVRARVGREFLLAERAICKQSRAVCMRPAAQAMPRHMTACRWLAFTVLAVAIGCRPGARPRLVWEGEGSPQMRSLDGTVRDLALTAPGVRVGTWGESRDATYQLLEVEVAEAPHVHQHHDLTIVMLRGRGTLVVGDRRYHLAAGDVVHIGRGRPHHFHPEGRVAVRGLGIFTPRLEGKDWQPLIE